MRLQTLELIRYGKFTDHRIALPAAPCDFHLLVGPNEAGKSTIRRAIGELLFGMPLRSEMGFRHPLAELRLGATIESAAGTLALHRARGRKPLRRADDDSPLPEGALAEHLGPTTEALYARMFCLDLAGLLEGGRTILDASDDVGQLLFQSAAGLSGLGALRDALAAEADTLYAPRKSGSRAFYAALDQHEGARQALKTATVHTRTWHAAAAEVTRLQDALQAASAQWQQLTAERVALERVRRCAPRAAQWRALQAELAPMTEVRLLPADALQRLADAELALARQRATQGLHEDAAQAAATRLDTLRPDAAVLAQATAIEAAAGQLAAARRQQQELARSEDELQEACRALAEGARELGWPTAEPLLRAALPSLPALKALAQWQRQAAPLQQRLQAADQALARARHQWQRLDDDGDGDGDDGAPDAWSVASGATGASGLPGVAAAPTTRTSTRPGTRPSPPASSPPPARLAEALADGQALRGGLQRRRAQAAAIGQARARLEAAQAALGPAAPPPGTLARTLAAQQPPSEARLNALLSARAAAQAAVQSGAQQLEQAEEQARRAALALQQASAGQSVVNRDDVRAARAGRDALWDRIQRAELPLEQARTPFSAAIARADDQADRQLAQAAVAAQWQALRDGAERDAATAVAARARHAAAQAALQAIDTDWAAQAADAGLPALPLLDASDWLAARRAALEADAALQAALADQAAEQQALDAATLRLRQALEASGVTLTAADGAGTDATPDLAELCAAAEARLQQHQAARQRAELLARQRADAQAELDQATLQQQAAEQALRQWQRVWQQAVEDSGLDPAWHAPEAAAGAIDDSLALHQRLATIDALREHRIGRLRQDIAAAVDEAWRLTRALTSTMATGDAAEAGLSTAAEAPSLGTAQAALDALRQRLDEARQLDQARHHATDELRRHREALDQARAALAETQARLAALATEAGTDDTETLRTRILASDRRRALQAEATAQQQALLEAGDGLDLPALLAACDAHPPEQLRPALQALDEALAEAVETRARLAAELQQARGELARTHGGDTAAQAEARRLEALSQMGEAAERYVTVATASRLLRWAIDRYRERRQGPLLARASALFSQLTLGRHARLATDVETTPPRLLAVRDDGERVAIDGLSEGTRDQLFLALRLAALELQIASDRPLPFIADDLFVNFHDARSRAGLAVLGELSRRTQVIFLTHHEHLVEVAREVLGAELNVVRLDAG